MAGIGVMLSAGGGRGVYAHTGFLLALRELGIAAGVVAGSSAGALVGGVAASGAALADWAEVLARVQVGDYWTPDAWPRLLWHMTVHKGRGYTGLSDTDRAIAFVRRQLAVQRFEDCAVPFYAYATNLTHGRKTLFASGELAPRIMASAAMPVLYRPVEIDGELYCDGGVIGLAPDEALCCRHGLAALLVHHTAAHRQGPAGVARALRQPWSLVEILYLLLYRERPWYLAGEGCALRACPYGCGAVIVVLEPSLPELQWPLARGGPRVQAAAYAQALAVLGPHADVLRGDARRLLQRAAVKGVVSAGGRSG